MRELELESVKHALRIAREQGYAEVELEQGAARFKAQLELRTPKARPKNASPGSVAAPQDDTPLLQDIRSPFVGYFGAGEALVPGKTLRQGETVATVTALGLMNEIEAPCEGEVVEVLVQEGEAVQYGQIVARVRP